MNSLRKLLWDQPIRRVLHRPSETGTANRKSVGYWKPIHRDQLYTLLRLPTYTSLSAPRLSQDESMAFPFLTRSLLYRSIPLSIFLLTVITALSAKMVTSWFNPKYKGRTFHKVLVIGVAQNLEVRADFEDEMASKIARPGIETIPGNQILLRPDPKAKTDLDYLRGQIRDNQIDAVVVSRLLKVDKKVMSIPSSTYVAPFPYYYSFYGYMGAVYPVMYDPGYEREDITVSVETNVYATDKPDDDLVWTGVSDSFNPKSAKKVADSLVKEVPKQMEKDGLLSKAK